MESATLELCKSHIKGKGQKELGFQRACDFFLSRRLLSARNEEIRKPSSLIVTEGDADLRKTRNPSVHSLVFGVFTVGMTVAKKASVQVPPGSLRRK